MIFPLVQGCQQQLSEDYESEIKMNISNVQPDQQSTEFSCEKGNMLTEEDAKQALLTMRLKEIRRSYGSKPRSNVAMEEAEKYEKIYNEVYEKFTESELQYAHDYADYTVVEITYMMRVIEDEDTKGSDYEVVEQWECDLKDGLCRHFWSHGNGGRSVSYGRFKKAKNGEWIAIIAGWANVIYDPDTDTWKKLIL
jgi:hypothetical protein